MFTKNGGFVSNGFNKQIFVRWEGFVLVLSCCTWQGDTVINLLAPEGVELGGLDTERDDIDDLIDKPLPVTAKEFTARAGLTLEKVWEGTGQDKVLVYRFKASPHFVPSRHNERHAERLENLRLVAEGRELTIQAQAIEKQRVRKQTAQNWACTNLGEMLAKHGV